MMCLPASIALAFAPASGSSVSYVAASGAQYVTSGTTISTPSTPSSVLTGDGLFAFVFARSALTPPAGWTLVASQGVTDSGAGITQTLYVYRRDSAGSGDSSTAFTWTQATAGRLGLAYILARSSTSILNVDQTNTGSGSITASGTVNIACATLTAAGNGQLAISSVSLIAANTSPATTTYAAPTGATLRTTAALDQNRMGVATQSRESAQASQTPFTVSTLSSSTYFFNSAVLMLAPG